MSRILAIIAEYNPLHNGHLYHIKKSIKDINPDYTVCIMSGNFCERGIPSVIDKWSKTEIALKCGFDLVIELPVVYSISSAENFAEGAIKILESFGDNVTLSFGSECGDLDILDKIATVLYEEPQEFKTILSHELSKGLSFPKARENALLLYLNDIRKYANILSSPNNILGIEYLKAMKKLNSKITPYTIKRIDSGYNSLKIRDRLASSTAIRTLIYEDKDIKQLVPIFSYNKIAESVENGRYVNSLAVFEKEILYSLRKMTLDSISNLQDVTEGLENIIKQSANISNNFEQLISNIKSKRYTRSRIQRIMLYSLLDITKKDVKNSYRAKPYLRILGVSMRGKILLSRISTIKTKYPVITSVKKFMESNTDKALKSMLEKDILASNIYTLGYRYDSQSNLDYTKKLIIYNK